MASKKITAMTDWAGGQVSTDLLTGVDLSAALADQNKKTTLNDLFSVVTKNITDGALRFDGFAAPTVSAAGQGSVYFDSTANVFKGSRNAGAYENLLFGSGTNKTVGVFTATADKISGYTPFTYDSALERLYITDTVFSPTIEVSKIGTSPAYAKVFGGQGFASLGNWSATLAAPAYLNFYRGANGPALPLNTADIGSIRFRPAVDTSDTPTTVGGARIDVRATENAVAGVGGGVGLTIFTAANGQTTDTQRFLINYLGAVMVGVNSATITTNTGTDTKTVLGELSVYDADAIHQVGNPGAGDSKILIIQGNAAQTKALTEWQDNAGALVFSIGAAGSTTWAGAAGVALSGAGQGRIYFDSGTNKFRASENGGAYTDLISAGGGSLTVGTTTIASGTGGRILYETSGNVLGETAGIVYLPTGSPNVAITAQDNAHTALTITPFSASYSAYPFLVSNSAGTKFLRVDPDGLLGSGDLVNAYGGGIASTGLAGNSAYLAAYADAGSGTVAGVLANKPTGGTSDLIFDNNTAAFYSDGARLGIVAYASSGYIVLGTGGYANANERVRIDSKGAATFTPAARSGGSDAYFTIKTPADTTLTASTQSVGVYIGGNGSGSTVVRQWATGTTASQSEIAVIAPTYTGAGISAAFTAAATMSISGAPIAGTNAIITNPLALWVKDGRVRLDHSGSGSQRTLTIGGNTVGWYLSGSSFNFGSGSTDLLTNSTTTGDMTLYTSAGYRWGSSGVSSADTGIFRLNPGVVGFGTSIETAGGTWRSIINAQTIASDQNNYLAGTSRAYHQSWSPSGADRTVTGLAFSGTHTAGEVHRIFNPSASFNIILANESASSTAANRFTSSTGADITIAPNNAVEIFYDGVTSRWRAIPLFSTGSGGLTIGTTAIASGTGGRLLYETSGNVLGETAGFTYQPAASPNVTITAQDATYTALSVISAATPSANVFTVSADNGTTTHFKITSTGAPSSPGAGSNSERYGSSSLAAGTNATAFGQNSTSSSTGTVAIGKDAQATGFAYAIALGYDARATAGNTIAIGAITRTSASGAMLFNNGSGSNTVSGANSIVLGGPAASFTISTANVTVLGYLANSSTALPTASGDVVLGGYTTGALNLYAGLGKLSTTPAAWTINGTGGSGSNIAGAAVNIFAGKGTGTGNPGTVSIQFARPGTTGSTINTLSDSLLFSYTTDSIYQTYKIQTTTTAETDAAAIGVAWLDNTHATRTSVFSIQTVGNASGLTIMAEFDFPTVAGDTCLAIYDVDNATVERVSVGAADSGGTGFKVLRIPN